MFNLNKFVNWRKATVTMVVALSVAPQVLSAQQAMTVLDLEFVPPQIAPMPICVAREPDADTVAKWDGWDGTRLPDESPIFIKRDINRLQQIDAKAWLPTIELMIARLAEVDPSYAGNNASLARIKAMESAGAFEELRNLQLVPQLAADAEVLSPRMKNALAGYFRNGIGVSRDIERGNALLIDAGYSGNADALLLLTKLELTGSGLEGWDVPPDLAVTMAFGSLVGELDPSICERASRIAREYNSGEIVKQSKRLAHDWFRFSADLGDSNSAWKIVEYHLEAEGFERDNAVLMHYLTQASDAQLPYAQIELGRVYENGSLTERNLDRSLDLFRKAAASGLRPGLTRLALFLEIHADSYPDLQSERVQALHKLAALEDAPGWVFTRLAEDVYERKGRWAGREEAIAYLEKASALNDLDGAVNLATSLIALRPSPREFERAVDLLTRSVSTLGGVTPTKLLHGAFMCQAQDSPRIEEAEYWQTIEAATDTANVEISAKDLISLSPDQDGLMIAVLQSHALYGRPRAMASYLKFLEYSPSSGPETLSFWQDYSNQYSTVLEALAKLEFELAENPEERVVAIDLLRRQYQQFGAPAALVLAQAMLNNQNIGEFRTDAVEALLDGAAKQGEGGAMRLLAALSDSEAGRRQVYETYRGTIEENGDFDALVFAVPYVGQEKRAEYVSRAAGIIPCDYKNVMTMTRLFLEIDDIESALHWMGIAEFLLENNAWSMVDLAENQLSVIGIEAAPSALGLYERAASLGDPNALRGQFEMLISKGAATFDPDRAAEMITSAVTNSENANLNSFLGKYRRADPAVKTALEIRLDMPEVYRTAANSGDIFSMRSYAMYLRDNAAGPEDMTASTDWLGRAAEGGDTTAMTEYGYALAFGIGIEANLDVAVVWLQRAAANGSLKAATITSLLNLDKKT